MQGLFVGDDQTPIECLKRDLKKRLGAPVEILNTGHLGYSPEQYYYTLLEYAGRFPPQFVVISIFANDFGDVRRSARRAGETGTRELLAGAHPAVLLRSRSRRASSSRAPWVNQIEGPQLAGFYPGNDLQRPGSDRARVSRSDRRVRQCAARRVLEGRGARGRRPSASPLFNGRIGDGHFSPQGCELWAAAVGRRLASPDPETASRRNRAIAPG